MKSTEYKIYSKFPFYLYYPFYGLYKLRYSICRICFNNCYLNFNVQFYCFKCNTIFVDMYPFNNNKLVPTYFICG